jgi:uncharacterized SAM-binding protein YcdF (DUF218 family)
MALLENSDARKTRLTRGRLCLLATLLLIVVMGALLTGAGRWLVREDPLSPGDVIVVLSGGMPYRAEEAAKIFRMGGASEVWVSRPESPAADLKELGIQYIGEEDYDRQILVHQGVPETAIQIFPDTIVNTEQEVEEVAREMRRTGKTIVIIVTSPQHTRRVKALWKRLVGANPKLIVRAATNDPFDSVHWWRTTRDALAVVREFLGLLNLWTGLLVRPHST